MRRVSKSKSTSAACVLYFIELVRRTIVTVKTYLTFSPIHLNVPTSLLAKGERRQLTNAASPVLCPGSKIEQPEKTCTFTSWF